MSHCVCGFRRIVRTSVCCLIPILSLSVLSHTYKTLWSSLLEKKQAVPAQKRIGRERWEEDLFIVPTYSLLTCNLLISNFLVCVYTCFKRKRTFLYKKSHTIVLAELCSTRLYLKWRIVQIVSKSNNFYIVWSLKFFVYLPVEKKFYIMECNILKTTFFVKKYREMCCCPEHEWIQLDMNQHVSFFTYFLIWFLSLSLALLISVCRVCIKIHLEKKI